MHEVALYSAKTLFVMLHITYIFCTLVIVISDKVRQDFIVMCFVVAADHLYIHRQ